MIERTGEPGVMIDEETLNADLRALQVKRSLMDLYWDGLTFGSYIPRGREWRDGRPQRIGSDIRQLLDSGETVLRIEALEGPGLTRREEFQGFFSRVARTARVWNGEPVHRAEITAVTHVGRDWDRLLPVLSLIEYGNPNPKRGLVVSVPDLARSVQDETASVALA